MSRLIFYTLSTFGLAYILGHSVITKNTREALFALGSTFPPLRWFVLLLECPACLGFWIGLVAGLLISEAEGVRYLLAAFAFACYTAGANFVLGKLTGLMPVGEVKD